MAATPGNTCRYRPKGDVNAIQRSALLLSRHCGPAAEYKVSEVADRNAGIVLKIRKDLLKRIQ